MNAFITSKSLPAIVQLDEEECGIRASLNRRHSHPMSNMRQELGKVHRHRRQNGEPQLKTDGACANPFVLLLSGNCRQFFNLAVDLSRRVQRINFSLEWSTP